MKRSWEDETALKWYQNLPEEDNTRNQAAITFFVENMANPAQNGAAVAMALHNIPVTENRYDKPISNNLLSILEDKFRNAHGIVTTQIEPDFAFYKTTKRGKKAGELFIQHPPVIFDQNDKILLNSIIYHELGHAIDWLNPTLNEIEVNYKFDIKKYANNIHEARRFADQLRYLLRKLDGDVSKVELALKGQKATADRWLALDKQRQSAGSDEERQNITTQINHLMDMPKSPFRLHPELMPVAKTFLNAFKNKSENWFTKKLAPLVIGATMLNPIDKDQTAIVQTQNFAQDAARAVSSIFDLLHFSSFVRKI